MKRRTWAENKTHSNTKSCGAMDEVFVGRSNKMYMRIINNKKY